MPSSTSAVKKARVEAVNEEGNDAMESTLFHKNETSAPK
jgi:hypothetical protein